MEGTFICMVEEEIICVRKRRYKKKKILPEHGEKEDGVDGGNPPF